MIVATFPKNATQEVRAQLGEYRGHPTASLWVFVATRDGETIPTKYGLSLGVESLPALEEAVQKLRRAAQDPASFR
jgi:hypothetical protein